MLDKVLSVIERNGTVSKINKNVCTKMSWMIKRIVIEPTMAELVSIEFRIINGIS